MASNLTFWQGDFGFKEALHYYDWDETTVQNNLYLPSNDPELNKPVQWNYSYCSDHSSRF